MSEVYLPSNILKFVDFLAREKNSALVPTTLEAVRHLPAIEDGPLFSVRKHIRANALGRDVVIKIFRRSLSPGTTSGPTEDELGRILKEIKILCSKPVALHQNLIDLESIEFGIHSGDPFEICPALVLERAPHGSLDGFLKKNKDLNWQTKKALCHDIASGLDCLHQHGVLHGDLQPAHVLIFDHPKHQYMAKLTGFGDSQIITRTTSADQTTFGGTKPFRAPEIEEGSTSFGCILKTDIFSAGLLFWSIFVNQSFSVSFDLPLDETFCNNDIMTILKLPYLFRFIPLLIEHEIGMVEEQEFHMLQKLFSCTVRLSPRSRDLKQALSLLGSGDEQSGTEQKYSKDDAIEPVHSNFDEIKVSTNELRALPYLVAKQYLKALEALHQNTDTSSEITSWIEFLCHFYGCGTEQNPQKATKILTKCLREEGESAILASILVPVMREALSIETEAQEMPKFNADSGGKIGPWIELGQRPVVSPEDHGLTMRMEDVISLGSRLQDGGDTISTDCGSSNNLLHAFAIHGQLEQIKHLIDLGVDVDAVNDKGETALLLACQYGNHEIATALLNHGANASIATKSGDSGLHWLCSIPDEHQADLALELVKKGARLLGLEAFENEKDWAPITPGFEFLRNGKIFGDPVLRAVANRDSRTLRLLLYLSGLIIATIEPRAQLILLITRVLERPLRLACEMHLYDMVYILCEEFHRIVLELSETDYPPHLQELLNSMPTDPGAIGSIFLEITNSTSPFRATIDMSFQVHRLCYHKKDWRIACQRTIVFLLKYGFIPKMLRTDRGPYTVLAYAVRCGNDEALDFLLRLEPLKASIDDADNRSYTLVHHAIEAHQFNALLTLAKNGATLDLRKKKDPNHCLSPVEASYLHVLGSVRCDDAAVVQLFLDHGVPATICDNRELSALSLALTRGAFTLARVLIENGASILEEGIYGVTLLGELFIPNQANQHDDLFSTFKFLLSYRERGIPVFITRQQHKYTVFHTAAAYYRDDELYPRMVETLFKSFKDRDLLEAQAATPAKSTALQLAIASYNPIVVKALIGAGASLNNKDTADRTPLDYAVELLYRLVVINDGGGTDKLEKLDRISEIIILLSEKAGWPQAIKQFPKLLATFDEAEPLLRKMMCSEHQVAFMRHLERAVLEMVGDGYADMMPTMLLHHLDLVRRVSMKHLQPALRMDLEYRVIPHMSFTNPAESFDSVKKKVPWCFSLNNNYLQDLQLAAAFEWLLDLIQRDAIPEGQLRDMAEVFKKFAFSGQIADLEFGSDIIRYPYTLLQWYEKAITNDVLILDNAGRAKIGEYIRVLRARKAAQDQGMFHLPPFDEEFATLHFDHLQAEKLDTKKAIASILLVTRCRCFFDPIGLFSRFQMTRMCQRMASIDDNVLSERLIKMRDETAKENDTLCDWKSEIGVSTRKTPYFSIMKQIFVDEKLTRITSLLAHPEDTGSRQPKVTYRLPLQQISNVPATIIAKIGFPYEPLDIQKGEIRLLTILPKSSEISNLVSCKMEHYSVSSEHYTEEYREYVKSIKYSSVRPSNFHNNWQEKNVAKRYIWGDFSCLSYTWGDPNDCRTIMINGHEVTVRSNLEAALRSLRQQEEFEDGLMLWIDALCINQADTSEREKTIRNMQNIYLGTHTVTVWLGSGSSETDAALQTVHDFVARYSKPSEDPARVLDTELLEPPPLWFAVVVYPAIVELMDRPYWRRLWIMQEITACAPCENIYLGDHRISWRELVLLLQSYMSSQRIEMNDEYTETRHNRVQANIHQAYILTTMAETYRQGLGLGKRNTLMEYGSGSSWMYLGKTSEVTDERDRVYGILGLIPEKISCHIMPNYAKSVEEVYKDLSKALIKATGSFDDSFAGSITNSANLASWAIDMQDASSTLPKGGKAGGFHNPYDDFLKTGQMYRIKVHKKPTPDEPNVDEKNDSVHYEFSDDGTILTVVAIHVDTVEGISGSVIRYTSPLKIIDAAWKLCEQSLKLREGTSARETVLRVLTADAEYVDEPNSSLFDIPFFADLEPDATLVEELHNNGWSNILRSEGFRLLHKFRIRKGEYPLFEGKPFEEWFTKEVTPCDEEGMEKALQAVRRISERTFITTEKGNLGSTGVAVKEGDRIFVAPGCSFPFLVRPDGDNYRVVGECYLDGFMNGEALDMLENGELEIGPIQLQ